MGIVVSWIGDELGIAGLLNHDACFGGPIARRQNVVNACMDTNALIFKVMLMIIGRAVGLLRMTRILLCLQHKGLE